MASVGVFTTLYRENYAAWARDGVASDTLKLDYVKWGCAGLATGAARPTASAAYSEIRARSGSACALPSGWPTAGGSEPTYTGINWYYCRKLGIGDVSVIDNVLTVACRLEAGEANDNGLLVNPSLYELGVFDAQDHMILYVAFDEMIKQTGVPVERDVVVTFG
jgi:hypothetical protein